MTRINAAIRPAELCDQMLLAEHREIKRIPNAVRNGRANIDNPPDTFTLGKGHVRFFYNKIWYLRARYRELHKECIKRGFDVKSYHSCFHHIHLKLQGLWEPNKEHREMLKERINERLQQMDNIRYYGKETDYNNIKIR